MLINLPIQSGVIGAKANDPLVLKHLTLPDGRRYTSGKLESVSYEKWDMVISVTTNPNRATDNWVLCHESPWINPESIFQVLHILHHNNVAKNVLIHCDSGVNRSPMMINAWNYWNTGDKSGLEQWVDRGLKPIIFNCIDHIKESTTLGKDYFWIASAIQLYWFEKIGPLKR